MAHHIDSYEEAAERLLSGRSELIVGAAMYPSQPDELLSAIVAAAYRKGVALTLVVADLSGKFAFIQEPEDVRIVTIGARVPKRLANRADYLPVSLGEIGRWLESGSVRLDAFVTRVAPLERGHYNLGPMISYSLAGLAGAVARVVDVNQAMPVLPGHPGVREKDVTLVVDVGAEDLPELVPQTPGPEHNRIGNHLSDLIPDRATLQLGIGSVPESFISALGAKRDLGIHSGAIPEAAIQMMESGVFTGSVKAIDRGTHVTTSLLGTRRLYAYAQDPTHRIKMMPVSYTHDPSILARLGGFYAVNSALQVDLFGQIGAEYAGGRRFASMGGQADFGKWAHALPGGANILALPSRAKDGKSRIVNRLDAPGIVTTHRADVDFVVTENGVAALRGRSYLSRARALIEIAHPADRESLAAAMNKE